MVQIEIRGCPLNRFPTEMLWFVYNDVTAHTQSGGTGVNQVEIQCQVFAYDCTEESPLRNTIFVRYKIVNRDSEVKDNMYFGLFSDFDIGNPNDDYFGSDSTRSLGFGYNGDNLDEGGYGADIPVLGVKMLRGPLDTTGNELPLAHVMPFDAASNPGPLQYYFALQGLLPNGSPAPNNGLLYPGNPNDPNADSELRAGNTPGQRSVVASYGPFRLIPGSVNELIAAYFYTQVPGNTPLQNVQAMYSRADAIQSFFDNCFSPDGAIPCSASVDASELPDATRLRLYPNPAGQVFTIETEQAGFSRVRVTDLTGQTVFDRQWTSPQQRIVIPVIDLPAGVYFAGMGFETGPLVYKKVVVARQ